MGSMQIQWSRLSGLSPIRSPALMFHIVFFDAVDICTTKAVCIHPGKLEQLLVLSKPYLHLIFVELVVICFVWLMSKALAYHCLPSMAVGYHFLRSASGCLPGGATCEKVVAIGIPKPLQTLPKIIEDPMGIETCLMVLAQINPSQHLVCPGSCKASIERPPEKSSVFYKEGIRLITINTKQLRPMKNVACAPTSIREANAIRPALKLISALANCMAEINTCLLYTSDAADE